MKSTKSSDSSTSSSISYFSVLSREEMMAMDDAEFFELMERELEADFHSTPSSEETSLIQEELEISNSLINMNLGYDESPQRMFTSAACSSSGQNQVDQEIQSSLGDHPHQPIFTDIQENVQAQFQIDPEGLNENERLHYMDELWEPTDTLSDPHEINSPVILPDYVLGTGESSGMFHDHPGDSSYVITRMTDKEPLPDVVHILPDDICYLGNSFNPDRKLDIYNALIRILNTSDFPYTKDQKIALGSLENKIDHFSVQANQKEELKIKSNIDQVIDLLADVDYSSVSHIVIHRHIAALINELEYWTVNDVVLNQLPQYRNSFLVDPASYIIQKLGEAFPEATEDRIEVAFFAERKDINIRLTHLFYLSKFPFTSAQAQIIKEIYEVVKTTNGNPDAEEDEELLEHFGKLIYFLNYKDEGERKKGVSNPKKVTREFSRLTEGLINLGKEERILNQEFEFATIRSPYLVKFVINHLLGSFIPRYTLPQPRAPNDENRSAFDNSQ